MFRAQPGGATFAVSIAKHAARHCARTKKHCSTPNYTGVVLTLSDKTAERRQRTE